MNDKNRKIFELAKKNVKLKTLLFLIFILIFNTCAWYIYVSEVSSDITTHVKSWNIEFGSDISQNIDFNVDNIYPGMENAEQTIYLSNRGELAAVLDCEVEEMTILGTRYVVNDVDITSDGLIYSLSNDYPFSIKFYLDDVESHHKLINSGSSCTVKIEIVWPFESGDDAQDTYWGNKAYDYIQANPDGTCIQVKAKIIANQT